MHLLKSDFLFFILTLDYLKGFLQNKRDLPMKKICSFLLFFLLFPAAAQAETVITAVPTQLQNTKVVAFSSDSATVASSASSLLNLKDDMALLASRLDAAIYRAQALTQKLLAYHDKLKTQGIKNTRLTKAVTTLSNQDDQVKQYFTKWKSAQSVFSTSPQTLKDYSPFRVSTTELINALNKIATSQKTVVADLKPFDKPTVTPKISPTPKISVIKK
jgi:hypothetical protein